MTLVITQSSLSINALPLPPTSSALPLSENDLSPPQTPPKPQSTLQTRPTFTVTAPALPAKPMPAYDYRRDPPRRHTTHFGPVVNIGSGSSGLQALPPLPAHVLNPNGGGGPMSARRYRERQLQKSIPTSPLARSASLTSPIVNKNLPTLPATTVQRSPRYVPSPLSTSATVEEDEDERGTSSESGSGGTAGSTPATTPGSSSADINSTLSYFGLQIRPRSRKNSSASDTKKRNRVSLPASMGGLSITLPPSLSLGRRPSSSGSVSVSGAQPAIAQGSFNRRSTAAGDFLAVPSVQRRASVASRASSYATPPQVPPKNPLGPAWQAKDLPAITADPKENWLTSLPAPTFSRTALPGVIMPLPATKKNRDMIASRNSSTSSLNSVRSNNLSSLSDLHLPRPAYAASRSEVSLHRRSGSGGSFASSSSTDLPLPPRMGPYGHHGSPSGSSSSSLSLNVKSQSSFGSMTSMITSPAASYKGKSTSTPDIQRTPQSLDDLFSPRRNTVSTTDLTQSNEHFPAFGSAGARDVLSTSPVSMAGCSTLCGGGSSLGHDSSCSSLSQAHVYGQQYATIRSNSSHSHHPSSTLHSHELGVIAEDPTSSCSTLGVIGGQVDKRPSVRSQRSTRSKTGKGANGPPASQLKRTATGRKVAEVGKRLRGVWKKMHQFAGGVQQQLAGKHKEGDEEASTTAPSGQPRPATQTMPSRKASLFRPRLRSVSLSRLNLDKPVPPPLPKGAASPAPPRPLRRSISLTSPGAVRSFEGPARLRPVSVHSGFEKPLPSTPGKDGLTVGRMVSVKAPKTPPSSGGMPVRRAVSMYGTM